jgi:hypothetical protein
MSQPHYMNDPTHWREQSVPNGEHAARKPEAPPLTIRSGYLGMTSPDRRHCCRPAHQLLLLIGGSGSVEGAMVLRRPDIPVNA